MTTLKEKLLKKCEFDEDARENAIDEWRKELERNEQQLFVGMGPGFRRGQVYENARLLPVLHTLIDVVERQRVALEFYGEEDHVIWGTTAREALAECDELLKGVME